MPVRARHSWTLCIETSTPNPELLRTPKLGGVNFNNVVRHRRYVFDRPLFLIFFKFLAELSFHN